FLSIVPSPAVPVAIFLFHLTRSIIFGVTAIHFLGLSRRKISIVTGIHRTYLIAATGVTVHTAGTDYPSVLIHITVTVPVYIALTVYSTIRTSVHCTVIWIIIRIVISVRII